MRLAWLVLLAGCVAPVDGEPDEVEWRLVESMPPARAGDAAVSRLPVLVLEPVPPPEPRLVCRLLRDTADVGEPAEVEIRVENTARPARVRLLPSREGVRVLGPQVVDIAPHQAVVVRFTCDSAGRASVLPVLEKGERP